MSDEDLQLLRKPGQMVEEEFGVAELAMTNVRNSDIVGRISADSFLARLTGADESTESAGQWKLAQVG